MLKSLFWFAAGFFVARYIILNTPDYLTKEAAEIDKIRNSVHDIVKKYAPNADDQAVASDVVSAVPSK